MGLNTVSKRTFHRHKNEYLIPAITQEYTQVQEGIFARIREGLAKVFHSNAKQ